LELKAGAKPQTSTVTCAAVGDNGGRVLRLAYGRAGLAAARRGITDTPAHVQLVVSLYLVGLSLACAARERTSFKPLPRLFK
jgi:hypothetical protein